MRIRGIIITLVPIRVGMILAKVFYSVELETCPHTRGDDPALGCNYMAFRNLSPYAWG